MLALRERKEPIARGLHLVAARREIQEAETSHRPLVVAVTLLPVES